MIPYTSRFIIHDKGARQNWRMNAPSAIARKNEFIPRSPTGFCEFDPMGKAEGPPSVGRNGRGRTPQGILPEFDVDIDDMGQSGRIGGVDPTPEKTAEGPILELHVPQFRLDREGGVFFPLDLQGDVPTSHECQRGGKTSEVGLDSAGPASDEEVGGIKLPLGFRFRGLRGRRGRGPEGGKKGGENFVLEGPKIDAVRIGQDGRGDVLRGDEVKPRDRPRHTARGHVKPVPPAIDLSETSQEIPDRNIAVHEFGAIFAVHGGQGRALEDPLLAGSCVPEMEHPEADDVADARVGGRSSLVVEIAYRKLPFPGVVFRGHVFEVGRFREDGRPGHPQRFEDVLLHESGVRLSGHPGDDMSEDPVPEIRIRIGLARRAGQDPVLPDGFVHVRSALGLVRVEKIPVHREAGRVIDQVFHGGAGGAPDVGSEFRRSEVVVNRSVEIDDPPLNEDHEPGRRHGLGERRQGKHGVRRHGRLPIAAGGPEALLPDDFPVLGHGHGHPGGGRILQDLGDLAAHAIKRLGRACGALNRSRRFSEAKSAPVVPLVSYDSSSLFTMSPVLKPPPSTTSAEAADSPTVVNRIFPILSSPIVNTSPPTVAVFGL